MPIQGFVVDFACEAAKLIIELDGGQHATANDYDRNRTAILEQAGYVVLRFWNNDVLRNMDGVLSEIAEALDIARASN
jgi:very-short-patch-repair endonuclease